MGVGLWVAVDGCRFMADRLWVAIDGFWIGAVIFGRRSAFISFKRI